MAEVPALVYARSSADGRRFCHGRYNDLVCSVSPCERGRGRRGLPRVDVHPRLAGRSGRGAGAAEELAGRAGDAGNWGSRGAGSGGAACSCDSGRIARHPSLAVVRRARGRRPCDWREWSPAARRDAWRSDHGHRHVALRINSAAASGDDARGCRHSRGPRRLRCRIVDQRPAQPRFHQRLFLPRDPPAGQGVDRPARRADHRTPRG